MQDGSESHNPVPVDPGGQGPSAGATAAASGRSDGNGSEGTYGQILKSSVLIGGSQMIVALLGAVRAKVVAVLLGPSGFGLMGIFSSIIDVAVSLASFGMGVSGVRQVAAGAGAEDPDQLSSAASVLWAITTAMGILGAILVIVFAGSLSEFAFGDGSQAAAIIVLSLAVLFRVWTIGHGALLQGLRRIRQLAIFNTLGALIGVTATIGLVYFFKEEGIVPALVVGTGGAMLVAWWFARQTGVSRRSLSRAALRSEGPPMLKLGSGFMLSEFMIMGAGFAIKAMILRELGLDAAGHFQAAWALGGLYVIMILHAMGADFLPRLTAVIEDDRLTNRYVNEQAEIGLLIAGPGIIATIALAPLLILILYTADFDESISVLRWICLGMAVRVLAWPPGLVIACRQKLALLLAVEFVWTGAYLGFSYFLIPRVGIDGAGMGFLGAYLVQSALIYAIVGRLSGFRPSPDFRRIAVFFLSVTLAVFLVLKFVSGLLGILFALAALVASLVFSARTIDGLVPLDRIPAPIRKVLLRAKVLSENSPGREV